MKPKNKKRKIFLIASGCVLLVALTVGVTFSYLTDRKTAENVFTVGDVYLRIEEPNYPEQESSRVMVAYSKISKDPIIKNTGINDEFVFMKVTVPLEDVTPINSDGSKGVKGVQEIFNIISNDANAKECTDNTDFSYNPNWVYIEKQTTDNTTSYVFAYNKVLLASAHTDTETADRIKTEPLFDEVQLKSILEGDIPENAVKNIKIEAYGIQSDRMYGVPDLNVESPTEQQLKDLYRIYVNQNGGTTP